MVVQRNEADVYRLKPGLNRLCRRVALNSLSSHVQVLINTGPTFESMICSYRICNNIVKLFFLGRSGFCTDFFFGMN